MTAGCGRNAADRSRRSMGVVLRAQTEVGQDAKDDRQCTCCNAVFRLVPSDPALMSGKRWG